MFFFFKQKTAYEMRISDWSSDVCSSDLSLGVVAFMLLTNQMPFFAIDEFTMAAKISEGVVDFIHPAFQHCSSNAVQFIRKLLTQSPEKIGRASCRERVCQYV